MGGFTLGTGAALLISSAQDLTTGWVDLGGEINTTGAEALGVYLVVDINDGANVRVRALAKTESGGTYEYSLPIRTISAAVVTVEAEYSELATDADQNILVYVKLSRLVPIVQLQVQAGTAGATAAQIDAASYTLGF